MRITHDVVNTLRAEDHGHPPIILQKAWSFNPDAGATQKGVDLSEEVSNPLKVGGRRGGGCLIECVGSSRESANEYSSQ